MVKRYLLDADAIVVIVLALFAAMPASTSFADDQPASVEQSAGSQTSAPPTQSNADGQPKHESDKAEDRPGVKPEGAVQDHNSGPIGEGGHSGAKQVGAPELHGGSTEVIDASIFVPRRHQDDHDGGKDLTKFGLSGRNHLHQTAMHTEQAHFERNAIGMPVIVRGKRQDDARIVGAGHTDKGRADYTEQRPEREDMPSLKGPTPTTPVLAAQPKIDHPLPGSMTSAGPMNVAKINGTTMIRPTSVTSSISGHTNVGTSISGDTVHFVH